MPPCRRALSSTAGARPLLWVVASPHWTTKHTRLRVCSHCSVMGVHCDVHLLFGTCGILVCAPPIPSPLHFKQMSNIKFKLHRIRRKWSYIRIHWAVYALFAVQVRGIMNPEALAKPTVIKQGISKTCGGGVCGDHLCHMLCRCLCAWSGRVQCADLKDDLIGLDGN